MTAPFEVIRDTREQKGWDFPPSKICLGTRTATLPTGDYSLAGYEDILTIERKGTTGELFANLTDARFTRELERLKEFKYPILLCEFTLANVLEYPKNSGIPPRTWRYLKGTPAFFLSRLTEIYLNYPIKIVLAGTHGRDCALSIFKRVVSWENR